MFAFLPYNIYIIISVAETKLHHREFYQLLKAMASGRLPTSEVGSPPASSPAAVSVLSQWQHVRPGRLHQYHSDTAPQGPQRVWLSVFYSLCCCCRLSQGYWSGCQQQPRCIAAEWCPQHVAPKWKTVKLVPRLEAQTHVNLTIAPLLSSSSSHFHHY